VPPERAREWKAGLPEEVGFWRAYLSTGGLEWPEEYRHRLDPDAAIQDEVLNDVLDELDVDEVELLDVGAGPLTVLGKRHRTKAVRITAVDPLADEYNRLLDELGIEPPVRTGACTGEGLLERFEPGTFDVAYARNALDHGVDPLKSIQNMLAVVRPGGAVVVHHFVNEGEAADYEGLHGWNFDEREGRFLIWAPGGTQIDVGERVGPAAGLACTKSADGVVTCVIRR